MQQKYEFTARDKHVEVFSSPAPNAPLIYLNTFSGEGERVLEAVREMTHAPFTLATISGLAWSHDMSPWDMPPLFKGDTPCTGGADEYLGLLTEQIVPKVRELTGANAPWQGLAGYSLAGLFGVYALYKTSIFSRIASVSGSLWFANFKEFVFSHKMKVTPECVYFSLGDKEKDSKNRFLQPVQENTEQIAKFYADSGIQTTFELNAGNHFENATNRTAAGIAWLLAR